MQDDLISLSWFGTQRQRRIFDIERNDMNRLVAQRRHSLPARLNVRGQTPWKYIIDESETTGLGKRQSTTNNEMCLLGCLKVCWQIWWLEICQTEHLLEHKPVLGHEGEQDDDKAICGRQNNLWWETWLVSRETRLLKQS